MREVSLFAMSRKGYVVLRDLVNNGFSNHIDVVIIAHDKNMVDDYYEEMFFTCKEAGIRVCDRAEQIAVNSLFCIAVSWRWMIHLSNQSRLIIIHDSLLPKYRGFSPLVNMLINREPFIGVSAIFASKEYDKGEIIAQNKVLVHYPIKINDAINAIIPLYSRLVIEIIEKIKKGEPLFSISQNENEASYSLWRDEDDYRINWNSTAKDIQQFVYSVGYPYKGASTIADNTIFRILDCEIVKDVVIENRIPGKVVFMENGLPVVVCKEGLIKITELRNDGGESLLPLKKFRIKFQ